MEDVGNEKEVYSSFTIENIVTTAMSFLGCPTVKHAGPEKGMNPEKGFDCSGFVTYVFNQCGVPLPEGVRHASDYLDRFGVLIHYEHRRAGDLIFYSKNGMVPTHMGILVSKDEVVHKQTRGICVEKIWGGKIPLRSGQIYSHNPIGFKRPTISNGRYQKFL